MDRRGFLRGLGGVAAVGLGAETVMGCSTASRTSAAPSTTTTRSTPSTASTLSTLPPRSSWRRPDSLPDPTRPAGVDSVTGIDHIVVVMQENHSFDNYFGMLGRGDGFTLDRAGRPVNANPYQGKFLEVYHQRDTCQPGGVDQSWNNSHLQWAGGTNQGFADTEGGASAMGYFTDAEIPYYWSLARTFPLCDRYFSSVLGQTYPNRRFLMAGTAYGLTNSDMSSISAYPPNGTIFDRLNHYGIDWRNYKSNVSTLGIILEAAGRNPDKIVGMDRFHADAAAGSLPPVSFVDSNVLTGDEENPQDLQLGEAFVADVVASVMAGPAWARTMLIWTYDEGGGWYDHVPPPPAIPPDDIAPRLGPSDRPGAYDRYGFRVPAVVVSARSRRDHVSHTVYDHTSILKTIETKWNLPALTYRDANARAMFDCLDLVGTPAFAVPPTLARPANPSGDSACSRRNQDSGTTTVPSSYQPPPDAVSTRRPSA